MGKNFRGETTEAAIWDFVSGVLKDPERLRRGLDEMLAREHSPSTCSVEEEKPPGSDTDLRAYPSDARCRRAS